MREHPEEPGVQSVQYLQVVLVKLCKSLLLQALVFPLDGSQTAAPAMPEIKESIIQIEQYSSDVFRSHLPSSTTPISSSVRPYSS